jgi:YVTN family beta-propeller protein
VINTATNTVVATVPVVSGSSNSGPYAVAITWDGAFAYVANSAASTVSVIDTATNMVITTIGGVGSAPHGVAMDGRFAYVTSEMSNTVSVIDLSTNTVVDTMQGVALLPEGIAIQAYQGVQWRGYPCRNLGG